MSAFFFVAYPMVAVFLIALANLCVAIEGRLFDDVGPEASHVLVSIGALIWPLLVAILAILASVIVGRGAVVGVRDLYRFVRPEKVDVPRAIVVTTSAPAAKERT